MILSSRICQMLFLGTKAVELAVSLSHSLYLCHWVRTFFFILLISALLSHMHKINHISNTKFKDQKSHTVKLSLSTLVSWPQASFPSFFLEKQPLVFISCGDLTLKNSMNTRFRSIWTETLISTHTMAWFFLFFCCCWSPTCISYWA